MPRIDWLDENGPGLHHFCLSVENVEEAFAKAPERGLPPGQAQPHQGTRGKRAGFLDRMATHAHIGDALSLSSRSDVHLAWPTAFDALSDHHLLITFCDAVLNHPTRSASCCRSRGWILTTVKEHSSLSFKSPFAPFGTKKVEKVRTGFLQKLRCLNVSKL